jgi:Tfp pilus assembly protein PilN
MIEINLLPDVKQQLNKAERTRSAVIAISFIVGLIAVGIVVVLAIYVFAVQSVRSALADEGIKSESAKLANVEDLSKVLTIQNQLSKISELNDQKKINSRIFDVLSAVIPPAPNNVQVSGLFIDAETKQITIEGQTRAFDVLEIFKKTIDGAVITYKQDNEDQEVKLASSISTSDIGYGEDASGAKVLRFTLRFVYAEELFSPTIPGIVIKLTNAGNVTDSYLGLPKSIFTQRATDTDETGGAQ